MLLNIFALEMASDDQHDKPPERQKILEEIRKRAEAAELKRLEEEDQLEDRLETIPEEASPVAPPRTPFPELEEPETHSTGKAAREQRVLILQERVQIALDRGRIEKAKELLAELTGVIPDDPQVKLFAARIEGMEQAAIRAKEKKLADERILAEKAAQEKARGDQLAAEKVAEAAFAKKAEPQIPVGPPRADDSAIRSEKKPRPDATRDRDERAARRKRVNAIVEETNSLYQQEKYDAALLTLEELFAVDAEHEEGLALREQITKAKHFADLISREETRQKAEETARREALPKIEPRKRVASDKDIWGTQTGPQPETPFDLAPQERGPAAPPKPPFMDRVVDRISKTRIPVRPLLLVGGAILVIILGYFAVENIISAVVPPEPAIVVLPVAVDPLDSTLALIADGLTEDIIRDLLHVSGLRVVNPVTALALRRSNASPPAISRSLGTNYLLQSALSRQGAGFVLTASFVDTASGKSRWSGKQSFSLREIAASRIDLVAKVLGSIDVKLPPGFQADLRKKPTGSVDAFLAATRARAMARRPDLYPPWMTIRAFEEALHADSGYADAQAGLGSALLASIEADKNAPPAYATRALFCVQNAMAGGLRSSEVFRVWGLIEQQRGQWDKAEERLRESVAAGPRDAESQRRLALLLAVRGDVDGALKAARRAATDDPGNVATWSSLGLVQQARELFRSEGKDGLRAAMKSYEQGLRVARDRSEFAAGFYSDVLVYLDHHDQAIDILIDRIARNHDSPEAYYRLGRAQQAGGNPAIEWQSSFGRARDALRATIAASPGNAVAHATLALVSTRLGAFKVASTSLASALQLAPEDPEVLYLAARTYALQRNNKEQALTYLSRALARRYSLEAALDMDFYNLRSDEQFVAIVKR